MLGSSRLSKFAAHAFGRHSVILERSGTSPTACGWVAGISCRRCCATSASGEYLCITSQPFRARRVDTTPAPDPPPGLVSVHIVIQVRIWIGDGDRLRCHSGRRRHRPDPSDWIGAGNRARPPTPWMHIPVLTSARGGSRCRIIFGCIGAWVPDCTPLVTALPDVIAARRRSACRGSTQSNQQGAQPAAGSMRYAQAEATKAAKALFCALFDTDLGLCPMRYIREWRLYVASARLADTQGCDRLGHRRC